MQLVRANVAAEETCMHEGAERSNRSFGTLSDAWIVLACGSDVTYSPSFGKLPDCHVSVNKRKEACRAAPRTPQCTTLTWLWCLVGPGGVPHVHTCVHTYPFTRRRKQLVAAASHHHQINVEHEAQGCPE